MTLISLLHKPQGLRDGGKLYNFAIVGEYSLSGVTAYGGIILNK